MLPPAPSAGGTPTGPPPGNRFLAALPRGERALLAQDLKPLALTRGATLIAPGQEVASVILPESGLVSIQFEVPDGPACEVGLVGREGLVGLHALLDQPLSPFRATVLVQGQGLGISVAALRVMADRSRELRRLIRRQAFDALVQAGANAACRAAHPLESRAARWLLMAAERVGPGFALTQDALAACLGARRPTVNAVLAAFRQAGLVRHVRGRMAVADAAGLEARSCACLPLFRNALHGHPPRTAAPPREDGEPSAP